MLDLHERSANLLERLGNSIYERDGHNAREFCFTVKEIHIVEEWLKDLLKNAVSNLESGG